MLPDIPNIVPKRPLLLLSGFFGAGKTTLIRDLAEQQLKEGVKTDVILNDYADAELDSATLANKVEDIIPLTSGCACCEGLENLCDGILSFRESKSDTLFIELNGSADPWPVLETLTTLKERFMLHPFWVVCVIDCREFEKRGRYNLLEKNQLETASHILLSHTDEVDDEVVAGITQRVKELNPAASLVDRTSLCKAITEAAQRGSREALGVKGDAPPANTGYDHSISHEFTSCQVFLPASVKSFKIAKWLKLLPENVMRAKVLYRESFQEGHRLLRERVGMELSRKDIKVPLHSTVRNSAILIGPELAPDTLLAQAQEMIHASCELA